jgi:hypothetical protein
MSRTVLEREAIEKALALLERSPNADPNVVAATETLKRALREERTHDLLTTAEAAEALGVRSINTIKRWVKIGYVQSAQRNERMMIPFSEIKRIQHDDRVGVLRATSLLQAEIAGLSGEGLSDEELIGLTETRPGKPPWMASK